ncbi:DUF4097 family beta strand repeat-containing protein [Aquimarina rhabdastrellae]
MKTIYYKLLLLLFIAPAILTANTDKLKGKYTKQKSINKEFTVNSDALLKINNDYGNLDIKSWDQNRIVMEISIKVNGNDEEKVIDKLNNIDVRFSASSTEVSAKTIFNRENQSWWDKLRGNNNNIHMEINYVVKMPITNHIDLNNDYGSITLDKIKGNATINCDYGQLILGEILGNQNNINFDYTKNSSIEYITQGNITADYSEFFIRKANSIKLNADYTKSKFDHIENLDYTCDYGSLKIDRVSAIKGHGDYLNTTIQSLEKSMGINANYGSFTTYNLEPTISNVNLKTDYVRISLGYDDAASFDFDINSSYGGITLGNDLEIIKKVKDNIDKYYQGYKGTKSSGNTIKIRASFGSIKLKEN